MTAGQNTYQGDDGTKRQQQLGTSALKLQRNRAYLLIGLLLTAVVSEALALAALAPLKTVIPAIATVDANAHIVKVQVVTPETITGHESYIHSELYDYVVQCNTVDPNSASASPISAICIPPRRSRNNTTAKWRRITRTTRITSSARTANVTSPSPAYHC
jgi:hypothetical protein